MSVQGRVEVGQAHFLSRQGDVLERAIAQTPLLPLHLIVVLLQCEAPPGASPSPSTRVPHVPDRRTVKMTGRKRDECGEAWFNPGA